MIRRRIVLGVLFLVLFGLGWWAGRSRATGDLYENLDLFVEILHKVEDHYVDTVDPHQLVEGAMKGMLRDLDPYSRYLDPRAYDNLQHITQGRFNGIGIEVAVRDHFPTIIAPIEGSPAWEAALQAGDAIVKIDGQSTADFTVEDTALKLRGEAGTRVRLTIAREGDAEPRDVVLTRREVELKSVPYAFMASDRVGYLRLASFSGTSGAEVRDALKRLHKAGAQALILDVRRNPGGLLDQAVDVVEQFVPRGAQVVSTRGRARGQNNRYVATGAEPETHWPMAVLVDEGSASASEIVAGALQDLDRALLVGRTTFGKGSVQSVYPLPGKKAALKLTTALYYTPSGRSIHRTSADSLLARNDEDEDEGDEDAAPDASTTDSAARPVYRTQGGRSVFGGGGIAPDLVVPPDTLAPIAREVERRGLALRFAQRWGQRHGGSPSGRLPAQAWAEFESFLRDEKVAFTENEIGSERRRLEQTIERELARRRGGDVAGVRVVLGLDPAFQRALAILERARRPGDVFAAEMIADPRPDSPRHAPAARAKDRPEGARKPASRQSRSIAP